MLLEFHDLFSTLKREGYNITLAWIPSHIGIRGNEEVDHLAKNAIQGEVDLCSVPFSDLKGKTQSYVNDLWQEEWSAQTDNKLFHIRPNLREFLPAVRGTRKEETVLTRLRTGHSYLMHSYRLTGDRVPWCISCDVQMSIKHLLLNCCEIHDIRHKHYTADSMKTLFRDVPLDTIFWFLREAGIFHRL